jgi:hypothetical protein
MRIEVTTCEKSNKLFLFFTSIILSSGALIMTYVNRLVHTRLVYAGGTGWFYWIATIIGFDYSYCGEENASQWQEYASNMSDVDFNDAIFIAGWPYIVVLLVCSYDPTVIEILLDTERNLKFMKDELMEELKQKELDKQDTKKKPDNADDLFHEALAKAEAEGPGEDSDVEVISIKSHEDTFVKNNNDDQVSLEKEIQLATENMYGEVLKFPEAPWKEYEFYTMTESNYEELQGEVIKEMKGDREVSVDSHTELKNEEAEEKIADEKVDLSIDHNLKLTFHYRLKHVYNEMYI